MKKPEKILVTGGTGLVGSHLLAKLALQKASLRAIYRKNTRLEKVKQGLTSVEEIVRETVKQ